MGIFFSNSKRYKKNIFRFFLLISLHWCVVAPSQNMLSDYIFLKLNKSNQWLNQIDISDENHNSIPYPKTILFEPIGIIEGEIGKDKYTKLDYPVDNVFKFNIENIEDLMSYDFYIEYQIESELFDHLHTIQVNHSFTSVSYVKEAPFNKKHLKRVSPTQLKNGINYVTFNSLESEKANISSIKIKGIENVKFQNDIEVYDRYSDGKNFYIRGFVPNAKEILFDTGELVSFSNGEFEIFGELNNKSNYINLKVKESENSSQTKTILADSFKEVKSIHIAENFPSYKNIDKGSNSNVIIDGENLKYAKLRGMDIKPSGNGLIFNGNAYRLLNESDKLIDSKTIGIKYFPSQIPSGYSSNDLRTMFFSYELKKWVQLKKDSIDNINHVIYSKFEYNSNAKDTDFINGIITTPESPVNDISTPNKFSSIEPANPLSELRLISNPSPSQKGEATLNYPLKIPFARNNLQPNLSLNYNSESGTGILGKGWSLPLQSISINTKWGIPVFDENNETESYLLNGTEIMHDDGFIPHRHRVDENNNLTTIFKEREVNAKFVGRKRLSNVIVDRIGGDTSTYYWKVTNDNGTISWYGGNEAGLDENSIIRDVNNNIVHWGLNKVIDKFGNNIMYIYDNGVYQSGGNLNNGRFFYPKKIFYNGYQNMKGNYQIKFNYKEISRTDSRISARLGIKKIDFRLLDNIEVLHKTTLIRKYSFHFKEGDFKTTLLAYFNDVNDVAEPHRFYYHINKNTKSKNFYFKLPVNVDVPSTDPSYKLGFGNAVGDSHISTTESTEVGYSANFPQFGLQIRFPKPNSKIKNLNLNFNAGKTLLKSKQKLLLTDFNGDGIPDYTINIGNEWVFYPGETGMTSENNTVLTSFSNSSKNILGTNKLYETKGDIKHRFNPIENFDLALGILGINARLGSRMPYVSNETSIYTIDANKDGLTDIVYKDKILFNRTTPDGNQKFGPSSEGTENLLITAEPIMNIDEATEEHIEGIDDNFSNYDAVRYWEAPKDGKIRINASAILLDYNASAYITIEGPKDLRRNPTYYGDPFCEYGLVDNVIYYASQLNQSKPNFTEAITNFPSGEKLEVKKGDKIFFRLHNSNRNALEFTHNISYLLESEEIDLNGEVLYNSSYEDNFVLDGNGYFSLSNPSQISNVSVQWDEFKVTGLTDDVKFEISTIPDDGGESSSIIYSLNCPANGSTNVAPNNSLQQIDLSKGKNLSFKVIVNSDVNLTNLNWFPKVTYTFNSSETDSEDIIQSTYITPNVDIYKPLKCSSTYSKINLAYVARNINFNQSYSINLNPNLITSEMAMTKFNLVVKDDTGLLMKKEFSIDQNLSLSPDSNMIIQSSDSNIEISINEIKSDINVENKSRKLIYLLSQLAGNFISISQNNNNYNIDSSNVNFNVDSETGLGSTYNNWGQFFYNKELFFRRTKPENEEKVIDNRTVAKFETNNFNNSPLSHLISSLADGCDPNNSDFEDCVAGQLEGMFENIPAFNQGDDPNAYIGQVLDSLDISIDPLDYDARIFKPQPNVILGRSNNLILKWKGVLSSQYTEKINIRAGLLEETALADVFLNDDDDNDLSFDPNLDTGMFAVSIIKDKKSSSTTIGGSFASSGATYIKSKTRKSNQLTDFRDLNGDGYPDIITPKKVQFSTPTGGHSSPKISYFSNDNITQSESLIKQISGNTSFSNSDPESGYETAGIDHKSISGVASFNNNISSFSNSKLAGSYTIGTSADLDSKNNQIRFYLDINGDGIADNITKNANGDYVYKLGGLYNDSDNNFNNLISSESKPVPINVSFGASFNLFTSSGINLDFISSELSMVAAFDIALGYSQDSNSHKASFNDINGDGLVDLVKTHDGLTKFYPNTGTGFSNEAFTLGYENPTFFNTLNLNNNQVNKSAYTSLTGNALASYVTVCCGFAFIYIPVMHLKFGVGGSINANLGISNVTKDLKDVNGDGLPDFVRSTNSGLSISTSLNYKKNKLRKVELPTKGHHIIDYSQTKATYSNPSSKTVMSSLITVASIENVNDEHNRTTGRKFEYNNGFYDRRNREFYGFGLIYSKDRKVESIQGRLQLSEDPAYRTIINEYHNSNYFLAGYLKSNYTFSGDQTSLDNYDTSNLHSKTTHAYSLKEINQNNEIELSSNLDFNYDMGGSEGRKRAAVLLKSKTNELYEFTANPIISKSEFTYDKLGRIKIYYQLGDLNNNDDNYKTAIEYSESASLIQKNIINTPVKLEIRNQNNQLLRKRHAKLDPLTGNTTDIMSFYTQTESSSTKLDYDQYGNVSKVTYPSNVEGQRMYYEYSYDNQEKKHVTSVKDAFGYSSYVDYSILLDKPLKTYDISGHKTLYDYDGMGRLIKIQGPNHLGTNDYTIKIHYNIGSGSGSSYSLTQKYDSQHPNDPLETFMFVDALGRTIQIKHDAFIRNDSGVSSSLEQVMNVSGVTINDDYGRPIRQYQSFYESKDLSINEIYTPTLTDYYSKTIYDIVDRPVKQINEVGSEVDMKYTIEDNYFKTTTRAYPSPSLTLESAVFKDAIGRTVNTVNYSQDGNMSVNYSYNAVGDLLFYEDAQGLSTQYEYDMLGRKTNIYSPDSGETQFNYDPAGNLILKITQNLNNLNQNIRYKYDYNRLLHIVYPDIPSGDNISNVSFEYGPPESGNMSGRITSRTDAAGYINYKYDNLGQVIEENRIVVSPNMPDKQFKTKYEYDSFNRLLYITYPDQEKVKYNYDLGGKIVGLKSISGGEYVREIIYNEFGQKELMTLGNGTKEVFEYTDALRRLNMKAVISADNQILTKKTYRYDNVGNITGTGNDSEPYSSPVENENLGGSTQNVYTYDDLNRLINAKGVFNGNINQKEYGNDFNSDYNLSMAYNNTGGILKKTQHHEKNYDIYEPNSYNNNYEYYEGTHKVKKIHGNQITLINYDANGNVTRTLIERDINNYFWDEENRLRVVSDGRTLQHYIYDAGGERVLKASSDYVHIADNGEILDSSTNFYNYTIYPNPLIVVSDREYYSKHYFINNQRVLTRLSRDMSHFSIENSNSVLSQPNSKGGKENNFDSKKLKQLQINDLKLILTKADLKMPQFKTPKKSENQNHTNSEVSGIYYFHSDHLGTNNILTDGQGKPYQFFINLPFGETMAEQRNTSEGLYDNPFKFNGKELDQATGLYYYGARYYNPQWSTWLSVDPLAEQMPKWSPYNYAFNNPLRFIDPDGKRPMDWWRIDEFGNAILVKKSEHGLYVNGVEMSSFNFTGNVNAFKQIHKYYSKQAKLNRVPDFYVNEFDSRGGLVKSDIPSSYKIRKTPASMSAFSEKMSGDKAGIITHLWGGKVYDPIAYKNKYNLINTIVHENEHISQNIIEYSVFEELGAMVEQMNHSSWENTSRRQKQEVKAYWDSKYKSLKKHYENTENGRAWLKYFKSNEKFNGL